MKADRLSSIATFASQAFFAVLVPFSWRTAAYGALSLAAVSLALSVWGASSRRSHPAGDMAGGAFPRLPVGSFLCFAAVSVLSLRYDAEFLFPYTGLFFALGLGTASLLEGILPVIQGKPLNKRSLGFGLGYAISAGLHLVFFPRFSYLVFGVGGLVLVSLLDIGSGIAKAIGIAKANGIAASARFRGAATILVFISLSAVTVAPSAEARERKTDEETYAALFGDNPGGSSSAESSEDRLYVSAIRTDGGDGFNPSYIGSFARELRVGQRLTRGELENAMEKIAERMEFSGRFYQATLSYRIVGGTDGATKERAVEITIRPGDGFWWDFNFQPYDLSIGYGNLFRSGKELRLVAGLNTQSLAYRDPAIAFGSLYWSGELGHRIEEDANMEDAAFLYESLWGEGETGVSFGDDVRLGVAFGYAAFRTPDGYFLYPDHEAPSQDELELLGLGGAGEYGGIASFALHGSAGAYTFRRRGGVKGRIDGRSEALLPREGPSAAILKQTLSGDLRFDAPRLLRLTLHEKVGFVSRNLAGGKIPEPLWADIDEGRYRTGLVSGEFASLSRASLALDPLASILMAFTILDLIPEVYYEFTAVRMAAYGDEFRWAQNVGFLLRGAFSPPVNRVFSLGLAFGLPSESGVDATADWKPAAALFLEIE